MNKLRLHHDEYVPFAPEVVGQRQRVNHSSSACDGDSQSLSIWRNDDDSIGAKCYRCGATGRTKSKPSMFRKHNETKALQEIPKDVSSQFADMPPEVATYVNTKGISEAIAYHYGIGWSESAGGLVLPVHNEYHHDGFQVKYFDRKQRYTTVHRGQRQLMFTHLCDGIEGLGTPVVIVEDLISAIRVVQAVPHLDAFALLGSELNDQGLAQLVKYHQKFIVWMDNDNDTVVSKAKQLYHRLSLFGSAQLIKEQCEPKDLRDEQILEMTTRR